MAETKREPRVHELLAVRLNIQTQSDSTVAATAALFEKKPHHFNGHTKIFVPLADGAEERVEEHVDIQTTVTHELKWLSQYVAAEINSLYNIAKANTAAKADIILEDGTIIAHDVPTSALLDLEKVTEKMFQLAGKIPTLDPVRGYTPDTNRGGEYFIGREVSKAKTKKDKVVVVKYPATDKHPAQTEIYDADVPNGTGRELYSSAMYTPARKAEILDRVEKLQRAVKRARMRANDTKLAIDEQLGAKIFEYAFNL